MTPSRALPTRLFNPREDVRSEHFVVRGAVIVGLTAIGSRGA
jgi:hypothetical protein